MKFKKIITAFLILSLVMIVIGGIGGYYFLMKDIKVRYSSLTSYDGTQIAIMIVEPSDELNRFGNDKYGVVVAHGIVSKAEANWPLIQGLAKAGFTVVALDERGHGNSGGTIEDLHVGENEYKDIIRCAEYLKEDLKCKKIGLAGHSMGGLAVTRAAIWAEKIASVRISGTVAISAPMSDKESEAPPEGLNYIQRLIYDIFLVETEITPFAKELEKEGKPENYLVVISEADDLIDISNAEELCNLAGGPGKDSKADFQAMNASDLYIIHKGEDTPAPGHGETPRDVRTVAKTIEWIENSMNIKEHYEFDELEFDLSKNTMYSCLNVAILGFFALLLPLYTLVKYRILKYNFKQRRHLSWTLDQVVGYYIKLDEKPYNTKRLLLLLGLSSVALFVSPLITKALNIPVLQTFLIINVLVRDMVIATGIIFLLIVLLKYESLYDILNWKNFKSFSVSGLAAVVILFIFFLGLNLFDNYYSINTKWLPFSFTPFIFEKFFMFFSLWIEVMFIAGVIEYICRKQIQDKMFRAEYHYTFLNWLKSTIFISIVKAVFITMAILGLFLAYDPLEFGRIFDVALVIISLFSMMLFISECFLTLAYQNSRDFWFINLTCYTYFVWYIASWLIRV
ncbi:MAG: alpha/beta hydrolase family protein [Promethearchaeota archaeon]